MLTLPRIAPGVMAPTVASLAKDFEEFKNSMEKQLRGLTDELKALKAVTVCDPADLKKLQGDFSELEKSVEFMSDALDAAKAENSSLVGKNHELIAKNEALERKVAQLEQYSRANNLEIRGVPVTKDEDCHGILDLLGKEIECPLRKEDIDTAHRVPTRKPNEMNIVVRFCSRDKRSEFLAKARKTRPTTTCLGFPVTQQKPVYVNEHLTVENKLLFSKALALKRQYNWLYLWTENGVIKARKSTVGRVFRIIRENDLNVFSS